MPVERVHVRDHDRRKPHQSTEIHVDDYDRTQQINPRPPPGREDLGPILSLLDKMAEAEERERKEHAHYTLDGDPEVVKFVLSHYELYDCAGTGKTKVYLEKDPRTGIHTKAIFADKVLRNGDFLQFFRKGEVSGEVADKRLRELKTDSESERAALVEAHQEMRERRLTSDPGWRTRGMKLLTKEDLDRLPGLYTTDKVPAEEKVLQVKFFTPTSNWTWYATEFDGQDTFFGYVEGFENEWGYFSLKELSEAKGPYGVGVERDKFWKPTKFKDYIAKKGG